MKLSKCDFVFIAEMRSEGIKWKCLAKIYGVDWQKLKDMFNAKMSHGFNKKDRSAGYHGH